MVSGGFYVDLGGGYQVLPRPHKWTLGGYVDIADNRRGCDDCWTGDFLLVCPSGDTPEVLYINAKLASDPTTLTDVAGCRYIVRFYGDTDMC